MWKGKSPIGIALEVIRVVLNNVALKTSRVSLTDCSLWDNAFILL